MLQIILIFIGYSNDYFFYNMNTMQVQKKDNVNDSELTDYLNKGVKGMSSDICATAESSTVVFENLEYGYYVVTSNAGAAISITSTAPDAVIIDKNQTPFESFSKTVSNYDAEGTLLGYNAGNTVAIGERMNYKVEFMTTNYFGDEKVKYYRVYDEAGDAIYIDVQTVTVTIDAPGEEPAVSLTKGYYLDMGEETKIGTWEGGLDDAQWYVVNMGNNTFRVTIPWLEGHQLTENTDGSYRLDTDNDNAFNFDTDSLVTITYDAVLLTNAYIGGDYHSEMINEAYAAAVAQDNTNTTPKQIVTTDTYGFGILKDDGTTKQNLAGAEFRLYRDADCQEPVNVVPTNVQGIYMVNTAPAKNAYADLMPSTVFGATGLYASGDNLVVSQVIGKLMVLGLPEGTYYLVETKAPVGYNSLTQPVVLTLDNEHKSPFTIYANQDGEVKDTQQPVAGYSEITHRVYNTTVHNSQGTQLPSTGGEGTIMLITIGIIVAMAFAVLMITQKKMSIYKD